MTKKPFNDASVTIQTDKTGPRVHLSSPQPAGNWLLLQLAGRPTKSRGGLDISMAEQVPMPYGIIIAKGPECTKTFEVLQHVMFPPHAGVSLEMEKRDGSGDCVQLRFVREEDIIASFETQTD